MASKFKKGQIVTVENIRSDKKTINIPFWHKPGSVLVEYGKQEKDIVVDQGILNLEYHNELKLIKQETPKAQKVKVKKTTTEPKPEKTVKIGERTQEEIETREKLDKEAKHPSQVKL